MTFARPWLPLSALCDGALTARLAECADDWAERWFAGDNGGSVTLDGASKRRSPSPNALAWITSDGGLAAYVEPRAQTEIAGAMLDLDMDMSTPTAADCDAVKELASRCVEDFVVTAARAFTLQCATSQAVAGDIAESFERALHFGITFGKSAHIQLAFAHDAAVFARKTLLPPGREAALGRMDDATRRQPIQVGALVGRGQVRLKELEALAVGDILVLDRDLNALLELTVNGRAKPDLRCDLHQDGARMGLRIASLQPGVPP